MSILLALILVVLWECAIGKVAQGSSCGPVKFENGRPRIISKRPTPTRMEFTCNNTFHLIGEKNGACLPNGRFSVNIPFCARSGCPTIQTHHHVTVTEEIEGSALHFECRAGMRRSGPQRLLCDGNKWTSEPPTCVQSAMPNCDFEEHTFCGWSQDLNDNHDWQWISKATPVLETGPLDDYTGKDHYILIDNAFPNDETHVTRLLSPHLPSSSGLCMTFDYQMRADDKEKDVGYLEIYVKDAKHERRIVRLKNQTGTCWIKKMKRIPEQCADFQIVLSATRGKSSVGYIAVDNIKFSSCPRNTSDTSMCSKDNTRTEHASSTISDKAMMATEQGTEITSRELRSKEELTEMTVEQSGTEMSLQLIHRLINDSSNFTSADDSLVTIELHSLVAGTSSSRADNTDTTWPNDEMTEDTLVTARITYSTSLTADNTDSTLLKGDSFSSTAVITDDGSANKNSSETNHLKLESSTTITIGDVVNKVLAETPSTSTHVLHSTELSDDSSRIMRTQTANEDRTSGTSYSQVAAGRDASGSLSASTAAAPVGPVAQSIAESSSAVFIDSEPTGQTVEYNPTRIKSGHDSGEMRNMESVPEVPAPPVGDAHDLSGSSSSAVSSPKELTVYGSEMETIAPTDKKNTLLDDGHDNKENYASRKPEIKDDINVSADLPLMAVVCLGTALGMSLMGWAAWKWAQNQRYKLENVENSVDEAL